jgi:hypothetical protein
MHWIGLDWFGLVWFGLVWIGLDWIGLDWFGLVWIGLVWTIVGVDTALVGVDYCSDVHPRLSSAKHCIDCATETRAQGMCCH